MILFGLTGLMKEMVKNKEIIYFVYDGVITQSVFDSQVLGPLKELGKNKEIKVSLIAFENAQTFLFQNKKLRRKEREITSKLNIRVNFYPRIPGWIGIYFVTLLLIPFLYKSIRKKQIVFHARGTKAAFIGCKLKKVLPALKVLYDSRGVEPEEYLCSLRLQSLNSRTDLTRKERETFRKLKQVEEYVIRCVDHIFSVSTEMKKHFLKIYNIEEKRISIVPDGMDETVFFFNEETRDTMRKEMGLRNKLVFVYSGSMHPVQMPRVMVKFFKEFYNSDKEVFFLILTFKVEKAEKLLQYELVPQENYKALSVEHSKVPMYLNAADIGMGLREKDIVSRVACPAKFAEYVACGLYTILTEEIGDISGTVEREKIGEVMKGSLGHSEMKAAANRILAKRVEIQKNENKEIIAQFAQTKYSWRNLMPTFWKTYEDLFKKHDLR